MKRGLIVVTCLITVFMLSGIAQSESWPVLKSGLLYKMKTGNQRCAIYGLERGSVQINCATMTGVDQFTEGTVAKCMASGVLQVCSDTLKINSYDSPPVKCGKVCGGTG